MMILPSEIISLGQKFAIPTEEDLKDSLTLDATLASVNPRLRFQHVI